MEMLREHRMRYLPDSTVWLCISLNSIRCAVKTTWPVTFSTVWQPVNKSAIWINGDIKLAMKINSQLDRLRRNIHIYLKYVLPIFCIRKGGISYLTTIDKLMLYEEGDQRISVIISEKYSA
jgi:hypothetical protein